MSMTLLPASALAFSSPRIFTKPEFSTSRGQEAVELAASAGLILDPWQEAVLEWSLGVSEDGKWSSFEVGLIVPRQNGKGAILEARELAGLFLWDEQLIIHTAHEFSTAQEHFRRILLMIEGYDHLRKRVKKILVQEVQKPFNAIMQKEFTYGKAFAWETLLMIPTARLRIEQILGKEKAA